MRLCIVFDQFQPVFPAQLADSVRVSALPVKVDYQNSPGTGRDGLLDQRVVDLIGSQVGLDRYGNQAVLGDGEDRGDIGVGRNDHFVARSHDAQFHIGTENPDQRVESVGNAHGMPGPDVAGIVGFEPRILLPLQVPARAYDAVYGFANLRSVTFGHFL